jgi:hypothetical protein
MYMISGLGLTFDVRMPPAAVDSRRGGTGVDRGKQIGWFKRAYACLL